MIEQEAPSPKVGLRRRLAEGIALWACLASFGTVAASAADPAEGEALYRAGKYDECVKQAAREVLRGTRDERWYALEIRANLARGNVEAAAATLEAARRRFPSSISLLLLGRDAYRSAGRDDDALAALDAIENLVQASPRRYATPEGRVTLGRYFLLRGADAKKVLDQFYAPAMKDQPDHAEVFLAEAELALEKQDDALAAETLGKAPKEAADDPRYHYLLARAFADSDRTRAAKELAEALKINPRHADSLLLHADNLVDGERYDDAARVLAEVLAVHPGEPRAWAYRAVLAHLRGDRDGEASARSSALARRATNPEVDSLIGRKLSHKYRFAEGSAYQRRALETDPEYLPAKVQLCQDLLRLGDEDEGWKLAAEIFARDGYNVVAYNLVTLRDRLAGFRTLQGDGFVVRMDPREADLYGARVLALLKRAKAALVDRYGVAMPDPVVVEIFPQKREFAVRTFGLPGAEGLLGVCFGRVITANSPASQGEHPANWESVLWHELCHVATLSKSRNKMPRWLSEGISVSEEERQDPAWGGSLSPPFRKMLLEDDLTPLSRLSSAFLAPKTPLHLQFAYYESALAVDFLVQRSGLPALRGLLDDLGAGILLDEALPRRAGTTLVQLDEDFKQYARRRAEAAAPGATWEEPDLPGGADSSALAAWVGKHSKSFPGWRRLGARLVAEEKWDKAKVALETLKGLYPGYVGEGNAYVSLATVCKRLSDPAGERAVLEELSARDGNASPAYLRLMELDEAAGDWKALAKDARRLMAVNPLIAAPHRGLGRASERLGDLDEALACYRGLAILDDSDPADVHYRLAKLLSQVGKPAEARREILKSLEEAPRFLDAHRLLLDLAGPAPGGAKR